MTNPITSAGQSLERAKLVIESPVTGNNDHRVSLQSDRISAAKGQQFRRNRDSRAGIAADSIRARRL